MASDEYPHNDWLQSCSHLPDAAAAWGMSMAELCSYLPMCPSTCDTCPGTAGTRGWCQNIEFAALSACILLVQMGTVLAGGRYCFAQSNVFYLRTLVA